MSEIFSPSGDIMTIHSRQSFSCPACGHGIGEAASVDHVKEAITAPAHRIIFEALSRKVGSSVRRDMLLNRIYGDRPDGGPEHADTILKVQVSQLRRKIEPYGWTISVSKGGSGQLAQWRLIPTTKSA